MSKARLLIVEDDFDISNMLRIYFTGQGYEVDIAVDGAQALDAVTASKPELILMDLSLPVMDGWEATRRLKSDPATASIPVIALTAHAMSGDREKAVEAGCDDYDTKPVNLKRLLEKMEALLGT